MRAISLILLVGCTTTAPAPKPAATSAAATTVTPAASVAPAAQVYPPARHSNVREARFGVEVPDPYRPLEACGAVHAA